MTRFSIFATRTLQSGFVIAVTLFMTFGCTGFQQPPGAFHYYTLHYPAPEALTQKPLAAAIVVQRFEAPFPYNSTKIVYGDNAYRRNTYVYHQWLTNPEEMLTECLVRDLKAANIAEAVLTVSSQPLPTHMIDCRINSFYEDDTQKQWQAVLDLTLTLTRSGRHFQSSDTPDIIFQKTYQTREPMSQNNPLGLARAMSDAMKQVSSRIVADVYQNLQ